MASFAGSVLLAYMLAISFTDEVATNVSAVEKLVDYNYSLNFENVIPGMRYNASIYAKWAVPGAALAGLEGRSVPVKVSASVPENSSLFFLSDFGAETKEASIYLRCDVLNASCANTSVLSGEITVYLLASPGDSGNYNITLKSEIPGDSDGLPSGGDALASIGKFFQPSMPSQPAAKPPEGGNPPEANFLDSLKPEGNPRNIVEFMRENAIISISALVIVILITGAYLLKSKD